jgi:predicted permease
MDAEMRHHIECETADRITRGMSPAEARRTALRDFGGIERYKEVARHERGLHALEELAADTRYALRILRRNPGYTVAAIVTFAVGIGLTTAIFGIVHGVLLRPLPYLEPDRLAVVWERNAARGVEQNVVSVPTFEAWRIQNHAFTAMAGLVPAPVTLTGTSPERVVGAEVSAGYFRMLGARPAVGRDFANDEGSPGGPAVVILSDGLWRRRFSADAAIVGRTIALDERPFTVVGIMPPDFDPPRFGWLSEQQLWLPFVETPGNRSWGRFLLVVGRLRNGLSIDDAERDIRAIAARRAQEDKAQEGWSASVVPLASQITGEVRQPLLVLMGAVALLLAMAATNVGSLTLGLMRRREEELAVRRALGASSARIFRQMLTHSLVLGLMGSTAGVLAAIGGVHVLRSLMPPEMPRVDSIRVDAPVLLFTTCIAVIATVAFGVYASRRGASGGVRSPGIARSAPTRVTTQRGSGSVVIAEIALGVVLTALAGLMVRSFVNLRAVNLGFEASSVVTARISLPSLAYGTADRQRAFFEMLGARVRMLPGVHSVSFATTRPFACCAPATSVSNPAAPTPAGVPTPTAEVGVTDVRYADSSYFPALRIPIEVGQGFASRERSDGPVRVVINRSLARALWGDANPVGQRLHVAMYDGLTAVIIGVAGDVHLADPRTPPRATVYLSAERYPSTVRDIIVRTDGEPNLVLASLRTALASVDPTLPLYQLTTLSDAVDRSLARDRFITAILSVFAAVSLLLAAVGIYGVFSGEVAARRKEIGVRLALGADRSGVVMLVLRRALILSVVGAAIGCSIGLMLSRSMKALVYDIGTSDPTSFLVVAGTLLGVAMLATMIPALRAARTSPLEAIRTDGG